MEILLKGVKIIDPNSSHHQSIRNVLIKNGKIEKISAMAITSSKEYDAKGMFLSNGWFDLRANFNDPGFEHKEDLESGCDAAMKGGFTGVAVLPNTNPIIQSKGQIEYIKTKTSTCLTDIYPIGAASTDTKGEEITEMLDMNAAGAIAFSDGEKPIWHTDLLIKSLQYLKKIDGLLMNKPEDRLLTAHGDMHEGPTSTMLGLYGMPNIAEVLMIKRDLEVLEYTGGKIHFSNISTKEAVRLIKEAKKKGLNVTCDVSVHHLVFEDIELTDFDTNLKSNPPFRSTSDRKALIKGLSDGTIDAIVSAHTPQDQESKKLEFDLAEFGLLGLQVLYPMLNKLQNDLNLELMVEKLTTGPKNILRLNPEGIEEGNQANLTLFDAKEKWTFDAKSNASKSKNSPLFGQELTGKVKAVFNGGKVYFD